MKAASPVHDRSSDPDRGSARVKNLAPPPAAKKPLVQEARVAIHQDSVDGPVGADGERLILTIDAGRSKRPSGNTASAERGRPDHTQKRSSHQQAPK
jgi:hypothetical protein